MSVSALRRESSRRRRAFSPAEQQLALITTARNEMQVALPISVLEPVLQDQYTKRRTPLPPAQRVLYSQVQMQQQQAIANHCSVNYLSGIIRNCRVKIENVR
jgi:hypothetical protein